MVFQTYVLVPFSAHNVTENADFQMAALGKCAGTFV